MALIVTGACSGARDLTGGDVTGDAVPSDAAPSPATLRSRPGPVEGDPEPGLRPLGLGTSRDGLLYVPRTLHDPAPLLVVFHGAGGQSDGYARRLKPLADRHGFVVVVPESRDGTWDVIRGGYGVDVAFVDQALAQTFAQVRVDPQRIAVSGFSDGGSYALSLGLSNGDLFDAVLAWSPGFDASRDRRGRPAVFVSHGTRDGVLPIDVTSRRIVPALEAYGYEVRYEEFDGKHDLPPRIVEDAVEWWLEQPD